MTDFRALALELTNELSLHLKTTKTLALVNKAREALRKPQPEPPTQGELLALWAEAGYDNPVIFARAVLARWGQ